jgi:ATP-dependent DNA helicase PIF1
MLAWGTTIHKSQGPTLEKAVVELGEKDFSAGLTFVVIS